MMNLIEPVLSTLNHLVEFSCHYILIILSNSSGLDVHGGDVGIQPPHGPALVVAGQRRDLSFCWVEEASNGMTCFCSPDGMHWDRSGIDSLCQTRYWLLMCRDSC